MYDVSIVVVSRNPDNCKALFQSLRAATSGAKCEVILSWNGDAASGADLAAQSPFPFQVLQLTPYHFAKNNNAAARVATGEILAFVNDDIVLDAGAIDRAATCFEHKSIGIVGGRLRYGDGRLQHVGVYFREDGSPFHLDKLSDKIESAEHRVSKFVPAVTGAFLLLRRAEFERLRFDESYEVAGEDIDLCLRYRRMFRREIYYCADASAVHFENVTRKEFGQKQTPSASLARLKTVALGRHDRGRLCEPRKPRIAIKTEKPGWIMHRQAEEIARRLTNCEVTINTAMEGADIAYYINYGYFTRRYGGEIVVANFTHYDPQNLAQKYDEVAKECDYCIAVSNSSRRELMQLGVHADKISVIENGADESFTPRAVIGVAGRVYNGGRKGEDLVARLVADPDVSAVARIVATNDTWGLPVWTFADQQDFYLAIDLLLIPSRLEGGPVPLFEALASGKLAIASPIGAVPDYPHIPFETGNYESMKGAVLRAARELVARRKIYSRYVFGKNWSAWAHQHELVFRDLCMERTIFASRGSVASAHRPLVDT